MEAVFDPARRIGTVEKKNRAEQVKEITALQNYVEKILQKLKEISTTFRSKLEDVVTAALEKHKAEVVTQITENQEKHKTEIVTQITEYLRTAIQKELSLSTSSFKRSFIMGESEEGSPLKKKRL